MALGLVSAALQPAPALEYSQQLGEAGSTRVLAEADSIDAENTQVLLEGDARLMYQTMQLDAGNLRYERNTGRAEATAGFRLLQPELEVRGESLRYETRTRNGELTNGEFDLRYKEGRGRASEIRVKNGVELEMQDVSYTSCPMLPADGMRADDNSDNDQPGWEITASELDIDTERGYGTADDATLYFEGVPILYMPRFWFPAGAERQTGFLAPTLGNSSQAGFRIGLPYYWNIATNYDATFTPRLYTKRGLQLESEFRYLHHNDSGILNIELTPYDRITKELRSLSSWKHIKTFSPYTTLTIDAAYASDQQYFEDYGSSLAISSQVFLPQLFTLNWQKTTEKNEWQAAASIESYQTLDDDLARSNRPYRRLPQLELNGSEKINENWDITLHTDWTWFHHNDQPNGQRLYASPGLQWQQRDINSAYKARAALEYRRYEGNAASTELTLPYFGLDAEWTFIQARNSEWLHTLTPKVAYRYRESQAQDNLPLFDTRLAEFGFDELFAANRFVGLDRLGDANQLGLGAVARWQKQAADLRLSLGNIFYFERPAVGSATGNNNRSDWLAEFTADVHPKWRSRLYLQTDESLGAIERSTVQFGYFANEQQRVSAAYRYQRETNFSADALVADKLEQLDVVGIWPVAERWHVVGRWLHSIDSRRSLETLAGFQYRSCCWTLRFAGRRFVTDDNEYNSSILLQLELHGLGNVGDGLERFIRNTR